MLSLVKYKKSVICNRTYFSLPGNFKEPTRINGFRDQPVTAEILVNSCLPSTAFGLTWSRWLRRFSLSSSEEASPRPREALLAAAAAAAACLACRSWSVTLATCFSLATTASFDLASSALGRRSDVGVSDRLGTHWGLEGSQGLSCIICNVKRSNVATGRRNGSAGSVTCMLFILEMRNGHKY